MFLLQEYFFKCETGSGNKGGKQKYHMFKTDGDKVYKHEKHEKE